MNPASESKKLAIQLRANEESYATGQLDLNETLDVTERLWSEVRKKSGNKPITANDILPDSNLMKLQTELAKRNAKFYKPDSVVFNSTEFSIKLKQYYDNSAATESSSTSSSSGEELLWFELGNVAKKLIHTVPSFNFLYGTFDPDPVEVVKKKRKVKEKDKDADLTKPISMNLNENSDDKDMMIKEAGRVLGILAQLLKKNEDNVICFYEFVTDPTSFNRTVENIFIMTLLVKEKCVRIIGDGNKLPCISLVPEEEKKESDSGAKQSVLTMSIEQWKDIVKTFKLKKPLIPPRK